MIESFKVWWEIFEDSPNERQRFSLVLDDQEYQGYNKDGEITWFQMQPEEENHKISMEELEAQVRVKITEWESTQS